jgi:hypothetical protein
MRWNVPASIGAPALTQRAFSVREGQAVDLFSADRVGDDEQAQQAEETLRRALDPDAVSRATNRHISDEVDEVAFATGDSNGGHWARVEATRKADAQLGYLFRAVYVMLLPRTWFGEAG